jgi:exodeoxyribonuclease V alpha subunit
VTDVDFAGVEFLASRENSKTLEHFLDRWHEKHLASLSNFDELVGRDYEIDRDGFQNDDRKKLDQLFSHWGKSRILCLTRVRPTGADRINTSLHERALDRAGQMRRPKESKSLEATTDFVPGEPVLMQINDYDRGVFNGDQGIILNVNDHGNRVLMVVFRQARGFVVFPIGSLRPVLRHAYAMTVHKAQGSEFDNVALVLPDRDLPINTPEILYTAITRSRRSVVILGQHNIFDSGVSRAVTRDSGIAEKLRA